MKLCFSPFVFVLLFLGNKAVAQDYYYPSRPDHITEKKYNYYKSFLDKAYAKNDYREIGVYLANMGASKKKVFYYFKVAIEENPSECYYFHRLNRLYKEDNFETTLTKLSLKDWDAICARCSTIMKIEEYEKLYQEKVDAYQNRTKVDSSKMDFALIERLKIIDEKDQRHRLELNKELTDIQEKELWKKQTLLDKENLLAIEKIFEEYGYPGLELVGREYSAVAFMVIHHYPDIKIKEKYFPFLEEAVKQNKLNASNLNALKYRMALYNTEKE